MSKDTGRTPGLGAMYVTKPFKFMRFGACRGSHQNLINLVGLKPWLQRANQCAAFRDQRAVYVCVHRRSDSQP